MRKTLQAVFLMVSCTGTLCWAAPGDILVYDGAFSDVLPVSFLHHAGIEVYDDYVIEFSGGNGVNTRDQPRIRKIKKQEFVENSKSKKIQTLNLSDYYPGIVLRSPEETVVVAESFLASNGTAFGSYDPRLNNCQHFAAYCKSGQKLSWHASKMEELLLSPLRETSYGRFVDVVLDFISVASAYYFSYDDTSTDNNVNRNDSKKVKTEVVSELLNEILDNQSTPEEKQALVNEVLAQSQ